MAECLLVIQHNGWVCVFISACVCVCVKLASASASCFFPPAPSLRFWHVFFFFFASYAFCLRECFLSDKRRSARFWSACCRHLNRRQPPTIPSTTSSPNPNSAGATVSRTVWKKRAFVYARLPVCVCVCAQRGQNNQRRCAVEGLCESSEGRERERDRVAGS